jgi:hypothetical protein
MRRRFDEFKSMLGDGISDDYGYWVWKNKARLIRVLQFRRASDALRGRALLHKCCAEGRPMELDRCLHTLHASRTLTIEDAVSLRNVALKHQNSECAVLMMEASETAASDAGDASALIQSITAF